MDLVRPIQDYAKSSIYVALHHMTTENGDLFLARDYLERVASSNAEEVAQAAEMLKRVKLAIQAKVQTEAEAKAQAQAKTVTGSVPATTAVTETEAAEVPMATE